VTRAPAVELEPMIKWTWEVESTAVRRLGVMMREAWECE
jgi:hypothetical protein